MWEIHPRAGTRGLEGGGETVALFRRLFRESSHTEQRVLLVYSRCGETRVVRLVADDDDDDDDEFLRFVSSVARRFINSGLSG